MKATKKIVGAACALVAAVALSAGSTFAWFTTNGTVSATGLEIDVDTSNSYLIIAENTVGLSAGEKTLSLAPTAVTKLLPSAYKTVSLDGTGIKQTDGTKEGGTASGPSIVTQSTWYTAQGTDSDNGQVQFYAVGDEHPTDKYAVGDTVDGKTLVDGDELVGKPKKLVAGDALIGTPKITTLTADNFDKYVVVADMVVSISKGSTPVDNVNVTMDVTVTDDEKTCPISVVFLYQTVAPSGSGWGTIGDWKKEEALATAGLDLGGIDSSDHYIAVKVMVYMDGNNEAVKTTNSAKLKGVTLGFNFVDQEAAGSGS